MKLNLGHPSTSGLSTTLGRHLLIELARIQTGTKEKGGGKLEEMKLNLGHPSTSGLSTTLGRHLLIELARIQTGTKLWVESDFDIIKEQRLNQT